MRYLITAFTILVFANATYAQGDAQISIGEKGNKYTLTKPINEKISASILRDDAKLHVTDGANNNKYIIAQYDVSVTMSENDLAGPFIVKDDNAQKVFDQLYPHIKTGATIFYNKIVVICRECSPPKSINVPSAIVTIE